MDSGLKTLRQIMILQPIWQHNCTFFTVIAFTLILIPQVSIVIGY